MSVVEVVKLRRYELLTNEGKRDVLVARKTLVGWVGQRQGPISINVAAMATTSHLFTLMHLRQQWHRYLDQVALTRGDTLIGLPESRKTTRCEEHDHP